MATVVAQGRIPLTKAFLGTEEEQAAAAAVAAGHLVGDGPICRDVESRIAEILGVRHVLLTGSCTHAMELAFMAMGLGPGDEVIMPSFTFSSTATSVLRQGARPVFADVDPVTWNIDPDDVARLVTPRTRAVMPIHYAGQAHRVDDLRELADRHGFAIVEDAAQCFGARYGGRPLGTVGLAGCFSFHVTKNVTCGEGGAMVTDDDQLARKAAIVREKGTNRSQFLRGEVDKYTWVDVGSSYLLSDVSAAILGAQVAKLDEINGRRARIWHVFRDALGDLERDGHLQLPREVAPAEPNHHIFAFLTRSLDQATVIARLQARGVGATFHYVPLHSSPFGISIGGADRPLPVTDAVSSSLVRLPLYPSLSDEEVTRVVEAVRGAFGPTR